KREAGLKYRFCRSPKMSDKKGDSLGSVGLDKELYGGAKEKYAKEIPMDDDDVEEPAARTKPSAGSRSGPGAKPFMDEIPSGADEDPFK
ncbi:unnamed protein product, partial [Polarella glacialis]